MSGKKPMYYAVARGIKPGIYLTWDECSKNVKGYKQAIYKKFERIEDANKFIYDNALCESINIESPREKTEFIPDYYVYTDGACHKNGTKYAKAGFGIYFSANDERNVSLPIVPDKKQTNNVAELTAIIVTFSIIEPDIKLGKKIKIVTDSNYAMLCLTSYGEKCERKGWDNCQDVPNIELVKEIYELYKNNRNNVEFMHIMAHTNNMDIHSLGNAEADKLANQGVYKSACK